MTNKYDSIDSAFDDKENEGFDELRKEGTNKGVPKCYFNGQYNYRTVDKVASKVYCCASDSTCSYYELLNGKDYCRTKVYGGEK